MKLYLIHISADTADAAGQTDRQGFRIIDILIKAIEADAIAATTAHLDEAQFLLAIRQTGDINQLHIALIVAALDNISQNIGGIDAGQAGDRCV